MKTVKGQIKELEKNQTLTISADKAKPSYVRAAAYAVGADMKTKYTVRHSILDPDNIYVTRIS